MRILIATAAVAAAALTAAMPAAAADIGVSLSIHQPGLHGRINIGVPTYPVVVAPVPRQVVVAPAYRGWYRPDPVVVWTPPRWRGHDHRHYRDGRWDRDHGRWDRDHGRWDRDHDRRGNDRDHDHRGPRR